MQAFCPYLLHKHTLGRASKRKANIMRGTSTTSLVSANSNIVALSIIGRILTIAVIVGTILLYQKFCTKRANPNKFFTKLFSFNHLYIENFMKILYILTVLGITAFCIWFAIASLVAGNIAAFFGTLIAMCIVFVLLQFLARISFEWTMIFIRGVVDIRDIRNKIVGSDGAHGTYNSNFDEVVASAVANKKQQNAQGVNGAGVSGTQGAQGMPNVQDAGARCAQNAGGNTNMSTNNANAGANQQANAQNATGGAQPQNNGGAWTCGCGKQGNTSNFCSKCGKARP